MASDNEKRNELLRFLDRKVFDPILKASPDDYGNDRLKRELDDVKWSTESEKRRFHESYRSASEVKDNFVADLDSKTAKRIDKELDDLDLPSLPKFKQEFLDLCERIHV